MNQRKLSILSLALAVGLAFSTLASAGTFVAFGPETYLRGTGEPITVTKTFSVLNPNTLYTLRISNGGPDGEFERVSSSVFVLNGVQVVGPSEFNQTVSTIEKPVTLSQTNQLSVEVRAEPGGGLVVQIIGEDNDPPIIMAVANPPPNAAGWNNSPVTVTFDCSDAISGIATCPSPVTVSTEGANQPVTGTAVDRAGNTAQATVTINLDKTPPSISANVAPVPNAAGWHRTDPTVTFTAADVLSGVASVSAPVTITTEGANQVVNGTAADVAGNSASTRVVVNLDKTPPVLTAQVTPQPNENGWNNSDVTVSFQANDALSGVQIPDVCAAIVPPPPGCLDPATLSGEGANQIVERTAFDVAGNATTVSVTVNIDKTLPLVSIIKPVEGMTTRNRLVPVSGTVSDANPVTALTVNGAPVSLVGATFSTELTFTEGSQTVTAEAQDIADNIGSAQAAFVVTIPPVITITSPANLSAFRSSPITLAGTVDDPQATVSVNGIAATVANGSFTASNVPLREGPNIITAVGTDNLGNVGTVSIQVTLDTTPPRVTIDSPPDRFVTNDPSVTVTGMINDIVVGTVNGQQAQVTVNGVVAEVANRGFLAADVPLSSGANTITAVGRDRAGNTASASILVTLQPVMAELRIELASGNNQTGPIGAQLPNPLVVALLDGASNPMPGKTVIFRVMENNGTLNGGARSLAVTTDAQGRAQARWTLGTRSGAGNNMVEASAVGFAGTAIFTATALQGTPNKINVDAGNNQFGVVGQPLPRPFVAVVTDTGHNRLANVPVTFAVKQGGGNFNGQPTFTVNTDSDGRAVAVLTLGFHEGIENNLVEANFPNNPGFPASLTASGRAVGDPAATRISGVVLDNSDIPIQGVTLRIQGTPIAVQSDAQGQFVIQPAPVGHVLLIADGSTAQRPGVWPSLEYDLVTVAGQNNTIGMPIYLLPLDIPNGVFVDETHGGALTLPEVPGFSLTLAPGSVIFPDGGRRGLVTVTVVHADKIPMTPNFGQQPRFIVTINPAGARFNPPAPITIPNVDGLAPGEITELYSFDHDIGSFVAIGTGHVSADGTVIISDPGVGIIKGGWHCGGNPALTGSCADCGPCKGVAGNECVPQPSKLPPDTPGDCQSPICRADGTPSSENADDFPPNIPGDCRLPSCDCHTGTCVPGTIFDFTDPPPDVPGDCRSPICAADGTPSSENADDFPPNIPGDCRLPSCDCHTGTCVPATIFDFTDPPPDVQFDCKQPTCNADGTPGVVRDVFDVEDIVGDCKVNFCDPQANVVTEPNPNDLPANLPGDCKQPTCNADGTPGFVRDVFDVEDIVGDCKVNFCDPQANVVTEPNPNDLPEDIPGNCRVPICNADGTGGSVPIECPFGQVCQNDQCVPIPQP